MTRKNEEQDKLPANELASASSDTSLPRTAAPQDPEYPAPTVSEASNNVLSPLDVLPGGIHVKVTYESMSPNDVIALIFNGDDTFVPQYGNDTKAVIFTAGSSHVAKALGDDILVKYVINGVDGEIASESLTLKILPLFEEDMTMIKIPQATESTPGKLDLSTFTGDAEFIIPPWPLIAEKQLVWMDMESESSTQHVLKEYSVTSDDLTAGVTGSISRAVLENTLVTKPEGTLLEFAAKVQLDDSGSSAGARPFPHLKLLLQNGAKDITENFETYASGVKPSPWDTPSITFTGTNLQISTGINDNRYFDADIQAGVAELTLDLKDLKAHYKRATVDLSVSSSRSAIFQCIYENGKVDEKRVELAEITTFEFIHDDISSFKVVAIYNDFPIKIRIDNLKLFVRNLET